LPRLALGGLVISLLAGILVPLYTDEVLWRLHLRAAVDGGFDITYNDLCGPNTIARAPWLMMPVRWFSAMINQALSDPLFVRLTGVSCALLLTALLWRMIGQLEQDRTRRGLVRGLVFSLLGLGFLPFLLILSRPEQPIVLCFASMILVTLGAPIASPRGTPAMIRVFAIAALSAIAVSYHAKGVLYLPVALGCVWIVARDKHLLPVRLVGLAAVLAIAAVAVPYWAGRFQCPGDAILAAKLAGENALVRLVGKGQVDGLIGQVLGGANPLAYPLLTVPKPEPMASWMPPGLFPQPLSTAFTVVIAVVWLSALLLAAFKMVQFARISPRGALGEPRFLLALTILACVFVWGCAQVNRNDYEAEHVLPMLAVFVALAVTLPGVKDSVRLLVPLLKLAAPGALLGQIVVLALTLGPMWRIAREPGYIELQPNSLSIAGYGQIRRDIRAAMAEAGFPTDRRLRRVLVDDLTYLALQDSYMPLHRVGVLSDFNGSIQNPAAYLLSRGSDGIVVGCKYLPLELSQAQSGQICAISRKMLEEVAAQGAAPAPF
jgi:hypothetical protein